MFGDQPLNFTLVAAGAVPRYHIVQGTSGTNMGGLATAVTQALVGVSQNDPAAAGEHLSIAPLGRSRITVGASLGAFARLTTTASGRATFAASGNVVIGYALEAAAADGDVIEAMIFAAGDKTSS